MTNISVSLVQLRESLNEAIEVLAFFDQDHPIASACQGRLQRMADFLDSCGKLMIQAIQFLVAMTNVDTNSRI